VIEIVCTCIKADTLTKNGRIYTKECLQQITDDLNKKIQEKNDLLFIHHNINSLKPDLHDVVGHMNSASFDGERISVIAEPFNDFPLETCNINPCVAASLVDNFVINPQYLHMFVVSKKDHEYDNT